MITRERSDSYIQSYFTSYFNVKVYIAFLLPVNLMSIVASPMFPSASLTEQVYRPASVAVRNTSLLNSDVLPLVKFDVAVVDQL